MLGRFSAQSVTPTITEHMSESPTHDPTSQPSDEQITPGGLAVQDNIPTLGKMQAGTLVYKWVVAIEGCKYLLSDAPSAAVLAAGYASEWTSVLGGLFVESRNSQSIEPFKPFSSNGGARIRILDDDGTDAFGTYLARRAGGDETVITATVDRNDTTINVKSTSTFASSGVAYIGTEAFSYTGVTSTSFTGCVRGLYSPLGCAASGSGGSRFACHHQIASDANHVQIDPVVSSIPLQWIGKRVSIRLHTWNETNAALNTLENSQLVFQGRIVGTSDDPDSFCTVLELEHGMSEFENAIIGKDILSGVIPEGIALITGREFSFVERTSGTPTANVLTVVAGTPASTNEIQTGVYSLSELCEYINRWLAGEKTAARINGYYSFASPVSTSDGMRTRCTWINNTAGDTYVPFAFSLPSEVAAFLGLTDGEPDPATRTYIWQKTSYDNVQTISDGKACPFVNVVFRPSGPGIVGQEFATASTYYDIDDVQGTFIDQYSSLPASIKASCDPSGSWGVFLFDEKTLIVGSYDSSTQRIRNIWISPLQPATNNDQSALSYVGRRADEASAGPVRIRQVFVLEGPTSELLLQLAYSTGTSGYNHSTYDTLGYGLSAGIPGEVLGPEFERALWNLPGADAPLFIIIDEATRFSELIGSDLNFRWAFVRWKDEHYEVCQWKTPLQALSIATLSESNKAAPPGQEENHRVASQETDEFQYSTIKIDYCRDFGFGRKGNYWKSVTFVDRSAAGAGRSITLSLRNTFHDYANAGSSVEAGLTEFAVHMPSISRGSRQMVRSLDYRYFETLQPGDIVEIDDEFARDPLTGTRSVQSRSAMITRVSYDLGGPSPSGRVRDISGEVELNFLDTQRGSRFAPSANVDYEATFGGFDYGYQSSTSTLRCRPHDYSHVLTVTKRGAPISIAEGLDASNFAANDVVDITERDPANPAAPTTWRRTISSVNGNNITFTSSLSSPAWDNTKKYRITYAPYASCQSSQQDFAFQADDTDEMIQNVEIPFHYSATNELYDFTNNSPTYPAENIPDQSYGDGVAYDVGTEAAIANTINAFIDYKSAHQAPFLGSTIGPVDNASSTWATFHFFPMWLGTEHLSTSVTRTLTVAPFFRSSSGGSTGKIRVAVLRSIPALSLSEGFLPGETFRDPVFGDAFDISDSTTWVTTSTTWQTGTTQTLSLDVKDISFGMVYVLVQGTGYAQCRGLAICHESPRQVV